MSELYSGEYHEPIFINELVGEELDREYTRLRQLPLQQLLDEYHQKGNE